MFDPRWGIYLPAKVIRGGDRIGLWSALVNIGIRIWRRDDVVVGKIIQRSACRCHCIDDAREKLKKCLLRTLIYLYDVHDCAFRIVLRVKMLGKVHSLRRAITPKLYGVSASA